ncbi:hypothetical protein J1605_009348 [Eschrichtius robustus]|uniref:Uncharacterized protein n=1 Tax=Eschrichtius robustus TaxID=9764 RepID=A0AB34GXA2_ESCRO|nr:hypothetical protein J1605_009348 [Eschrichtius robustus]
MFTAVEQVRRYFADNENSQVPCCGREKLQRGRGDPVSWSLCVCLEHRSTESQEIQSRVLARVGLSPECPLRAEKHSPAGEGPEDSPWERSHVVPTRGLGDAGATLSCQQPRALDHTECGGDVGSTGAESKGWVNVAEEGGDAGHVLLTEPPARRAVGSDCCDRCRRPGGPVLKAAGQAGVRMVSETSPNSSFLSTKKKGVTVQWRRHLPQL